MLVKCIRLPHKGSFFIAENGENITIDDENGENITIDDENGPNYCMYKKMIVILPIVLLAAIKLLSISN